MSDIDILATTRLAVRNPVAYFKTGIDYIESRLNGAVVPDPLSPMVQQLEISSAQACAHIEESMAGDRRNYAILARTMRDLYANASDYDMINRFSQPSSVKMHLMFPREELVGLMVAVTGSQLRKVVIPRNTEIVIDSQNSLVSLYPIEIRQPIHKGVTNTKAPLMVVYNTDQKTSLQSLDDNIVDWYTTRSPQGREFLDITMDMLQLKRTVTKSTLNGGTYNFDIPYTDYFHATRVFYGSDDGGWKEFAITYSQYTYASGTPTIIATVEENVVNFRIPPVYITNGLVPDGTGIRFDVYSTVGPLDQDLSTYATASFKLNLTKDLDDPSLEPYAAPLRSLEFSLYSTDTLTGGTLGLTFNQMQNLIVNNISIIDVPITPAQIVSRLETLGFDVIKNRDDLTNRVYLASKTLSPATASTFNSAPASGILTLQTKFDDLVKFPGVWDNNARVTISPETLFRIQGGLLELVDPEDYPGEAATTETQINLVNAGEYVFSPFHYVLDTNNNNFDLRAYRLANPEQTTREFIHENETTQLEISTAAFKIERTSEGYLLTVTAQVGANWMALTDDQRFAQVGFIPYGETNYAYLNGEYKGRVALNNVNYDTWEFPIHCTFDLDANNNLIVDNFAIFTEVPRSLPLPLSTNFVLTYSVTDYIIDGLEGSDVDGYLGRPLLPLDIYGVTAEYVGIKLGSVLSSLWANRRSLGGSVEYKKYDKDVLAVWEADEYEIDPVTKNRTFTIDANNNVKFNLLHAKGDPVLVDGVQKVLYPAGTVMLDPGTQEPIPVSERPILRLAEMFMVDGVYFYANDTISQTDLLYLSNSIVDTYIPSLETLSKRKLENTDIYLYPKKTIGSIPVYIDDAVEVTIQAQLSFQVRFLATETGYMDMDFRGMVESIAESAIATILKNRTVSTSAITAKINQNIDERISGFVVKMFSNGVEMTTFTTKDDAYRSTVRRLAALNDDGKIVVKEDIKYEWEEHIPEE
jgi:hypothetical protein